MSSKWDYKTTISLLKGTKEKLYAFRNSIDEPFTSWDRLLSELIDEVCKTNNITLKYPKTETTIKPQSEVIK